MDKAYRQPGWSAGVVLALSAFAPALVPGVARAQATDAVPAPRPEPRFDIKRFEVVGADKVPQSRLADVLAPLTGPGRRFSDIESAVQAVRDVYADVGIAAVQVLIPEQALEEGVVRLQVEELQVARMEIAGAQQRSRQNVLRAVPGLREGVTPVDTELSAQLRLANENPGRQMQVTFRTEDDGTLTGVLRVADRSAWSTQLSMDNTGTAATGEWRAAAAVQHSNLLDRDIVGSAQVQTSPGHEDAVKIGSLSVRVPLYRLGLLVDASAVHSSVDSGTVKTSAGDYLLSSSGNSLSLRVTRLLPRWGAADQRVSIGQDWRLIDSRVTSAAGGSSLVPDILLRPVSLSYSLLWREEPRSAFAQASVSRNLPGGGRSAEPVFEEPGLRAGANPRYTVLRASAGFATALGAWTLSTQWNGQWTEDALVAAEQFGIGGEGSIRGFNGRVASADTGHRLGIELQSPVKTLVLGAAGPVAAAWAVFAEAGEVRRNLPQASEKVRTTLGGAGVGLRLTWRERLALRADLGVVTRGDGLAARGDHFIHFSLSYAI
ncbi:MAG: ShlB/FhaC/HecB family hemolysin secretion/activation protein [Betaproteobacteria bacterium]